LRISPDAILVVDDDPGEIAQIRSVYPNISVLHARSAAQTLFWLRHCPGLRGYRADSAGAVRLEDLGAAPDREALRHTAIDPLEYIRSLQVRLRFSLNPPALRDRMAELANKTNQFNTGLNRFSAVEVARRIQAPDHYTVAIHLSDRFADSGSVGVIFARVAGQVLWVDEVCISCRALGRGIESSMIALALAPLVERHGVRELRIFFRSGPRNQPARSWLESLAGVAELPEQDFVPVCWQAIPNLRELLAAPLAASWEPPLETR
jgi:FkbH-like protein